MLKYRTRIKVWRNDSWFQGLCPHGEDCMQGFLIIKAAKGQKEKCIANYLMDWVKPTYQLKKKFFLIDEVLTRVLIKNQCDV